MKIKNIYNYPNLPLPEINEVMDRFKEWVEPLLTPETFEKTKTLIDNYKNSPDAQTIHNILLARAKDKDSSWLIDWWVKNMYLASRGPVTPECNAPMIFRNENIKKYQLEEIVAIFIHKISSIYLDLFNHPDKLIDDQINPKKKFSLDQLIYLFASMREPHTNIDTYYTSQQLVDYVVILKNNVVYKLQVIENNKVIDLNHLKNAIKAIINANDKELININYITCFTNRDEAYNTLLDITSNEQNKLVYDVLKNAIFCASIDLEFNNIEPEAIFKNFLNAKDYNKLHGKSLLINFDKNENICFAVDHTMIDGGTYIYLMMKVYDYLNTLPSFSNNNECAPYEIVKHQLNDNQIQILKDAHEAFINYINASNIKCNVIERLNKNKMKELNIISSDGFIQLMYQLAQYKTNHKLNNIYVAVDVRNFFKGRTECIRPISNVSKQFVIDFVDNNLRDKNKIEDYLKAIYDIHYNRSKLCQNANGINRYLLGMKLAYEENKNQFKQKPSILDSEAYIKASYNFLSTSSIIAPCIEWVYFDPVVADGLGIFYAIDQNDFRYCISGWNKDKKYHEAFFNNLSEVINEILDILEK